MCMLTSLLVTMATGSVARVALVTGGTKGIGLGIARGLGEANYRVHLTGRTAHGPTGSLEAAASAVRAAGGEAVVHQCDHSNPSAIQALFDEVLKMEPDGIDLCVHAMMQTEACAAHTLLIIPCRIAVRRLVNNVYPAVDILGDTLRSGKTKFWQLPATTFADVNDVGLTAHYTASAIYAKAMVPKGRGLIIQVSSPGGLFYFFTAAYSTGKAALDRMTTDLAHELRGTGLGCVGLYPGMVATEKFEAFAKEGVAGITTEALQATGETPLYSGRAVAKLAEDAFSSAARLEALSGTIQWTAEVAVAHDIKDEKGRQPLSSRSLRRVTGLDFLPASWVVPWFVLRFLSPKYPSTKTVKGEL